MLLPEIGKTGKKVAELRKCGRGVGVGGLLWFKHTNHNRLFFRDPSGNVELIAEYMTFFRVEF